METLLIGRSDVRRLLPVGDCIAAVERAFRLLGEGRAAPPGTLAVHAREGAFHIKAGVLELGRSWYAAKSNGNFPLNPGRGLPTIQGLIVLADAADGRVLAVLDSMELTALRTAAATAVAAKHLARPDARVATMVGCGAQAPSQLRALAAVLPLERVYAHDRVAGAAASFAAALSAELGLEVVVCADAAAAVRSSDVCVTCTTSREFVLGAECLHDGLFVAGVGVDHPEKRELSPELLARAKLVVDGLDQCASIGDLRHALEEGVLRRSDVHAELGAVVAGRAEGRVSAGEVFVFDSTGIALQDVAAAAVVYERALAEGRGVRRIAFDA
jgi:ornithine cyclodeaminase/alanine dehydrogenase-like protein (mu-crystallin family)